MKFYSTIFLFFSFLTLAFSAAISKEERAFELAKREVSNTKYVPTTLPDGKKSISVYDGDVLEGSLVEGDDGDVIAYDPYGKVIDLDAPEDDESGGKVKRQGRFGILRRFYSFIRKYGTRAWNFLYCISFEVAIKCTDEILGCASLGIPPWQCLEGIVCGGVGFKRCV